MMINYECKFEPIHKDDESITVAQYIKRIDSDEWYFVGTLNYKNDADLEEYIFC